MSISSYTLAGYGDIDLMTTQAVYDLALGNPLATALAHLEGDHPGIPAVRDAIAKLDALRLGVFAHYEPVFDVSRALSERYNLPMEPLARAVQRLAEGAYFAPVLDDLPGGAE